ncbi:MAG: L-2-hydroxyglutarate oxidase [Candidatus Nanopelagicales bacterium]|nr:L-2-hydroxyglutarate oxidase [Candidatus Nanopelagicales bacterium]
MPRSADLVVIGGGIVGLALADAWLTRTPADRVIVVDKEPALAAHASGRNSGVLHAGFYYAPDSLKARLTRQGNALLHEFCREQGVAVRETGKVVVAQSADQLPALLELQRRGTANGVDVELIDEQQLRELEPLARTHEQALWSPTTGVADPAAVVEALARRVRAKGGEVLLGSTVTGAGPRWVMTTSDGLISAGHIINAAGLHADVIAHWFGVGTEYRMLPFKGLYWYGSWAPGRLQRHVYPVPDARNPFLGVHLTVTVDGRAKIGPTAIPALWREDYGGLGGWKAQDTWEIARTFPRFLASDAHDVPGLIRSELPKYSRKHLVRQAAALVPSVRVEDFVTKGRVGVRAQLFHLPTRTLEMDFVVRPGQDSTHILNAVSPGWTSALAFADYVIDAVMA